MKLTYICSIINEEVYVEHEEREMPGNKRERGITKIGRQKFCYKEDECKEIGVTGCVFANNEGKNPLTRIEAKDK
jgi:hypothetical protein